MRTLFSIFVWIYYTFCFVFNFFLVALLFVITYPFDPYRKYPNKAVSLLAAMLLRFNPYWKISIKGQEKYDGSRPTIFIANHQSFFDLPLAYLLPWGMKWVTKKGLIYIPFFGWIIRMTGHLTIDRSRMTSVRKLEKLVNPLQENIPVMIFPEGTRSRDGKLKRFKNGAFQLAKKHNIRLQPLVFNGGHEALPTHEWRFKIRQKFFVSVLDPINPDNFESIDELKSYSHKVIADELEAIQMKS